jgi:hypothetical protein
MKRSPTLLVSCLLAALAVAAPGADTPQDLASVDRLIGETQQAYMEGKQTTDNFVAVRNSIREMVINLMGDTPDSAVVRDRLIDACTDCERRARAAWATDQDFYILRERLVNARLDRALVELERMCRAADCPRWYFDHMRDNLNYWADVARSSEPTADVIRERLERGVTELERRARAATTAADWEPLAAELVPTLREDILHERLNRAMTDLERRARAGQASRVDFLRAAYAYRATCEACVHGSERDLATLRERLNRAIEELGIDEGDHDWTLTFTLADFDTVEQLVAELKSVLEARHAATSARPG